MTRTSLRVSFPGSAGDDLAARLDLPDGEPVAFALFAHCFTCSKDIAAATRISRGLVAQGFGVLRFDFTGLGASGGEIANTTFSSSVEDLVRADRHDWPLEQVSVQLEHGRVHADDCRDPVAQPCVVDHIDRTLHLDGPLTDEQRARLLDLADRCPVHRTLTGEIRVATRLA